ncbi:MAG TPA: O-antigen ligase family protein [Lysobacter sp.]
MAALPTLLLAFMRWKWNAEAGAQRVLAIVCLAAIALALLQLMPLPPYLHVRLPGRGSIIADLAQAQQPQGWLPLTLDRRGTVRALLALVVFSSFWVLSCTLTNAARLRLLKVALVLAALMAMLGYAQSASGARSGLRFHTFHHPIGAIGLFANRNHFACLMAMLTPLAIALGVRSHVRERLPAAAAWYVVAAMLLLAAALSLSRTGMVLASVAAVVTVLLMRQRPVAASARQGESALLSIAPVASIAVAVAGIAVYAWDGIRQRMQQDPLEDLRWQYLRYGWDAALAYLPWGAGWGSFKSVYPAFEPIEAMREVYALHVHDDVLETLIEAGLPGVVLLLAAFVTVVHAARKNIIARNSDASILSAAAIAAFVPMAHSFVDYPLRTHAVAVVLALVLSLLMADADASR